MNLVPYETENKRGVRLSITRCDRLKYKKRLVGTRQCIACSYCYDIDSENKLVRCRKNI